MTDRIARRVIRPPHPIDLALTLAPLRHGTHDPTIRMEPGRVVRAARTALGPGTIELVQDGDAVEARAWGPGAPLLLDQVPALIGCNDRFSGFGRDSRLHDLARRFAALRMCASLSMFEALLPTVLEQKVAGAEARRSYAGLVRQHGVAAPGPLGLRLQPEPELMARLPYFAFHPLGVERRRAEVIRMLARRAPALERLLALTPVEAAERLMTLPGIGTWTAATATHTALGDPDAVPLGDFHIPHLVSWTLAGEPRGDDRRMLELLEPYRGQRARVIRLLKVSGDWAPRRGPRYPLRSITRI